MFFEIAALKNSELLLENIGTEESQVFKEASLIKIYNSLIE